MGVKSNVKPAMRKWLASLEELKKDVNNESMAIALLSMEDIGKKGFDYSAVSPDKKERQIYKKELTGAGVIAYRAPSQKGRTKNRQNRKNKYAPRDRGRPRVRKIFKRGRIVDRSGVWERIFKKNLNYSKAGKDRLVQNGPKHKITVQNKAKSSLIQFDFYGKEGRRLRLLSYGGKRTQPLTLDNGKQLKGRKKKRDVVANGIRRNFNSRWNKAVKGELLDYKRVFNRIK